MKYIDNSISEKLKKYVSLDTIYDNELRDFLKSNGMMLQNYDEYFKTPFDVDSELKKLDSFDFETCCALITMIFHEDHFNNGSFDRRCKCGDVQKVLARISELL